MLFFFCKIGMAQMEELSRWLAPVAVDVSFDFLCNILSLSCGFVVLSLKRVWLCGHNEEVSHLWRVRT